MTPLDVLNLHQLRVLVAVVEHGSFGAAAKALGLTQPAVTAQIRHLRAFVGTPVFARNGRYVVLTEAGRTLYRHAQEILGTAEALQRNLAEIAAGERDRIIVGGSLAYATYVLPSIIAPFQLRYQNVRFSVIDSSSREMVESVRTGTIDAAVVTASRVPAQIAATLAFASVGSDEVIVIEAADAPFSGKRPIRAADLALVPFITAAGRRSLATALHPLFANAGVQPPQEVIDLGTWEGIKDAVRTRLGVAVVFRSVAQRELNDGTLHAMEVEGFRQTRELSLIVSPDRRNERMTEVFRELLGHLEKAIPAAIGEGSALHAQRH
jgi:DNA-binding transcriptional LysR family regulator